MIIYNQYCSVLQNYFFTNITFLLTYQAFHTKFVLYSAESTISAINNTVRYGLETLNNAHEDFSLPFETTQADNAIIKAPEVIAVHK